MKLLLAGLIAVGLSMPMPIAYAATQSGQSVSTLQAVDHLLVAKKKKKASKKSKAKVAKK